MTTAEAIKVKKPKVSTVASIFKKIGDAKVSNFFRSREEVRRKKDLMLYFDRLNGLQNEAKKKITLYRALNHCCDEINEKGYLFSTSFEDSVKNSLKELLEDKEVRCCHYFLEMQKFFLWLANELFLDMWGYINSKHAIEDSAREYIENFIDHVTQLRANMDSPISLAAGSNGPDTSELNDAFGKVICAESTEQDPALSQCKDTIKLIHSLITQPLSQESMSQKDNPLFILYTHIQSAEKETNSIKFRKKIRQAMGIGAKQPHQAVLLNTLNPRGLTKNLLKLYDKYTHLGFFKNRFRDKQRLEEGKQVKAMIESLNLENQHTEDENKYLTLKEDISQKYDAVKVSDANRGAIRTWLRPTSTLQEIYRETLDQLEMFILQNPIICESRQIKAKNCNLM